MKIYDQKILNASNVNSTIRRSHLLNGASISTVRNINENESQTTITTPTVNDISTPQIAIQNNSNVKKQNSNTIEMLRSNYPEKDFKAVPRQVHMIWVASFPQNKQTKYIKDWAEKNPEATINLWVDSRHFKTYQHNKVAQSEAYKDISNLESEYLLKNLYEQAKTSINDRNALEIAVSELNKELAGSDSKLKSIILEKDEKITSTNFNAVFDRLENFLEKNKEKFLEAEAKMLNHTVTAWDTYKNNLSRDIKGLELIKNDLDKFGLNNIRIRDLSDNADIVLINEDAYQHEMIGRGGAYPAASDIARYEILNQYGGIYSDVDLECKKTINFEEIKSHPELLAIGMAAPKKEEQKSSTPYIANALIASHKNSKMLNELIKEIKAEYDSIKLNDFAGIRYFARPNKATIERTGPNKLREMVSVMLEKPLTDVHSKSQRIWDKNQNNEIWEAIDSHFTFPDGLVEFETPEQAESETKALSRFISKKSLDLTKKTIKF